MLFLAALLLVPRWVMTHPDRERLQHLQNDVQQLSYQNSQLASANRRIFLQAESTEHDESYQRELARERAQKFPENAVRVRFR